MMLLRAASLARGALGRRGRSRGRSCSSCSTAASRRSCRSQGSVGASGDLAPLAHLALVLIGEGEAWLRGRGACRRRGAAPRRARAARARGQGGPGADQRHAAHDAVAVLALADAEGLAGSGRRVARAVARGAAGHSTRALRPAHPRCAGRTPGRSAGAANLAAIARRTATSGASHADCGRVQDAYCLRCVPQVLGAVRDALAYVAPVCSSAS